MDRNINSADSFLGLYGSHSIYDPYSICAADSIDLERHIDFFNSNKVFPNTRFTIKKVMYNNKEHIILSGGMSSIFDLKSLFYVSKSFLTDLPIFETPHYQLANCVINNIGDYDKCLQHYRKYMFNQFCFSEERLDNRVKRFLALIDLLRYELYSASNNWSAWTGEVYCRYSNGFLSITDGFHRASIIAALGYKVIPVGVVIKANVKR